MKLLSMVLGIVLFFALNQSSFAETLTADGLATNGHPFIRSFEVTPAGTATFEVQWAPNGGGWGISIDSSSPSPTCALSGVEGDIFASCSGLASSVTEVFYVSKGKVSVHTIVSSP
jgi:hypothetical protein